MMLGLAGGCILKKGPVPSVSWKQTVSFTFVVLNRKSVSLSICGRQIMSFGDGYAFIYSHIQEERIKYSYQCGARHVLLKMF